MDWLNGSHRHMAHRLSKEQARRILVTCNEQEFSALGPSQIVPVLASWSLYIRFKHSYYRVLHAH